MSLLRLFRQFILRALLREKARSATAAAGMALGVAVMIAVRLANTSVTDTFEVAVDSVSGEASLRIRGTSGPFDELQLRELGWLEAHAQLCPVIDTYAMVVAQQPPQQIDEGFTRGELLHVLGVDVLLDFDVRDYRVLRTSLGGEQSAREVLNLLRDPNSVILTEKFLRRKGLRVGDEIRLAFGSRQRAFRIRGVLLNRGPARTLDGNFALMDIAAAQLAADQLGLIDYVDLRLAENTDRDAILAQIRDRLPAGLAVEFPDAAANRADTMISAFQFNLTALSVVALLVGLFLIYNTVTMSVAARRDEIGMLRAAGAGKKTVLVLFLGEAALLAIVGVVAGLPLGRLLASFAVRGTAQTVETFYIAGVAEASAAALRLTVNDALVAILLAVPLALLAALIPAGEAASVPPVEAVRGTGLRLTTVRLKRCVVAALICVGVGWILTWCQPVNGRPVFGFLAELFFMIGGAFFSPVLLWLACQAARTWVPTLVPRGRIELRLASANLLSALPRVSISVAALAVSLSMMIAIAVMVGSFRKTVVYWLDSVLSADLSVKPVMQSSSVSEARLSTSALEIAGNDDDVVDAVWFASRQIPLGERTFRLTVTDLDKVQTRGRLLFKSPPLEGAATPQPPADAVFVSESFSFHFGAERDGLFELPTPRGNAKVRVDGIYYDYANNQGTVLMDAGTYRRLFAETKPQLLAQNLSLYLKEGADPQLVRQRILNRAGDDELLYCVTNSEIRREALRIFESTFTVTYALLLIAILVAGLGVASTLITLIYQRQREIGLLALVGATHRQTRRIILCEAVMLGAVSQLIGIGIGLILACVLIFVINVQSFGWTIQFHIPWQFFIVSTMLVIVASGLFGLYPAVRAAGADPLQTVREQ